MRANLLAACLRSAAYYTTLFVQRSRSFSPVGAFRRLRRRSARHAESKRTKLDGGERTHRRESSSMRYVGQLAWTRRARSRTVPRVKDPRKRAGRTPQNQSPADTQ
jgi:hypothetical protein